MNDSRVYVMIAVAALVFLFFLLFLSRRIGKGNRITPLAGLAFGFILAGIVFGEQRWLGYSLFGVGIVLAIIDLVRKSKPR